MAQTLALSGTIQLGSSSNTVTLSKSFGVDHLRVRDLVLAAGDLQTLTFDNTVEGTNLTFLFIEAKLNADLTQHADVKFSVLDADGADPANGTAWRTVNGIHMAWENLTLSATYKLYIYNAGSGTIAVKVAAGLDG